MNKSVDLAIRISADASGTAAEFDKVGSAALGMADDVDRASRTADDAADRFGSVGDAADELGGKTSQAAGGLGDLGGALSLMPGPLGAVGAGMESLAPLIMGVTGASDLLNLVTKSNIVMQTRQRVATIASTVATKASTVATRALNLAMRANPIGLVITAVTLLVAGFVLLYNRSERFRAIVQTTMRAGREAVGWVVDKADDLGDGVMRVIGWVQRVPGSLRNMADKGKGYLDRIIAPFEYLWDLAVKVVDKIQSIDFPDAPGWLTRIVASADGAEVATAGAQRGITAAATSPTTTPGGRVSADGPVQIIIQGALDPDAVARQIEELLATRRRRVGAWA